MATGIITGTVKVGTDDGAPASSSIVRAYDRITGILVTEVTADVNGEFSITVPDDTRKYTLTAINNLFPGYNAGIDDNKSAVTVVVDSNPITLYLKPTNPSNIFIEQFVSGRGKYFSYKGIDASGSGTFFTIKQPSVGISGNSAVITSNSTINYATRSFNKKLQWDIINFYFKINTTQVSTASGPRLIFYSEIEVGSSFAWHIVEFIPRAGSGSSYRPLIGRQINRGTMAYQSGSTTLSVGAWYFCNIRISPTSGVLNTSIFNIYDRDASIALASPGTTTPVKAECASITFYTAANSTVEVEFANIQIVDSQGFFLNLYPRHLRPNN